jgi:hypothetical protein
LKVTSNYLRKQVTVTRGGRNVKFHYYDRLFFSLHRNCLFSSSLLQHHYIKNGFLVHHYYDKKDFRCSDFTYGVKKDHNVKNWKYQLPMAYYLWLPRPVGG